MEFRTAFTDVREVWVCAYKHVVEGGTILAIDNDGNEITGRLTSVDAVQLRLHDTQTPLVHHEMHAPLAKMHLLQTNDG